jgi:hypothetical protein
MHTDRFAHPVVSARDGEAVLAEDLAGGANGVEDV